jgi:hypothetical protein
MKTLTLILGVAVAASVVPVFASAQQTVPHGGLVTPSEVKITFADGTDTGWINYQEALDAHQRGNGCGLTASLMFDAFGADTDGITPIGADTECGLSSPGTRYTLNADEDSGLSAVTVDDFTVAPGYEGGQLTRITGAFYNYGDGNPANTTDLFLQIFLYDEDLACEIPRPIGAGLGNVAMIFAGVANNPGTYSTYDLDVCAIVGDALTLPEDGSGSFRLVMLDASDFSNAQAQPMIWGTSPGRPGQQAKTYWRGAECFDIVGDCPEDLGTMIAFFGVEECAGITPGDVNNDTVLDLLDVIPMEALINSPAAPTQDQLCRADLNADDLVNHFDQSPFLSIVAGGPPAAARSGPRGASPDITFFLAEDGLSNPAIFDSQAVNPVRENPEVAYVGGSVQRLYIWSLHIADDLSCRGLSFNVQATGGIVLTNLVIYDSGSGLGGTWGSIAPGAGAGQRWEYTSASSMVQSGLFTGFTQEIPSLEHPHVIDDLQLVGHIDYAGVGEIFLEVGHSGIIRDGLDSLPGPGVGLGFGDAPISGSAYNTASAVADAVTICLGDLNGDNMVDTADLGGLLGSFGSAGPFGDINGDGTVDTADLGILLVNFGSSCAP